MPDILEYTLAQLRGFVAASARSDASRDGQLLSLIAMGTRGDSKSLEQTLERLMPAFHSS